MPASAQLLVILVAVVAFWAIAMRPARNQQRKVQQLQRELEVGDQVVISAGIFGTIRSLTDTRAEIEVAPGTVITVARQVVVRRVEDIPEDETATGAGNGTGHGPGSPTAGTEDQTDSRPDEPHGPAESQD